MKKVRATIGTIDKLENIKRTLYDIRRGPLGFNAELDENTLKKLSSMEKEVETLQEDLSKTVTIVQPHKVET